MNTADYYILQNCITSDQKAVAEFIYQIKLHNHLAAMNVA
jgi:hypothetical protein